MGTRLAIAALPTLDELRDYVHRQLCEQDRLDPSQTPLNETVMRRRARICGVLWQVQGPRLLKSHALWAADENRVLFYDSGGVRWGETRLCEAPDPLALAA
jgi:hypothetical protein